MPVHLYSGIVAVGGGRVELSGILVVCVVQSGWRGALGSGVGIG